MLGSIRISKREIVSLLPSVGRVPAAIGRDARRFDAEAAHGAQRFCVTVFDAGQGMAPRTGIQCEGSADWKGPDSCTQPIS
ncbi:hypothetical protein THIARS_60579 [Thiomonas delicata]|uniref:Uncharacterized protein n=1 Tax=Thiomonas delicata TaxID=364030 RepID=A0A238D3K8_THIDL|nr:hypothetical protein THIARS_60579 [Thiomonas delicata]